jgi:DNA-binding PucR family transcriptional regulator
MYAGISSPVEGIRSLSQAARQSSIALDTAFDRRDGQWVLSFSDCALDYLLHSIRTDLAPRHLIAPEWLALLEHDRKSGTQYFQTLKTFLLMERDIPKTARTLIIHRTTLLYRLDRILELTGLNLDDPDRRLYLLLSLRLMEAQELTGI